MPFVTGKGITKCRWRCFRRKVTAVSRGRLWACGCWFGGWDEAGEEGREHVCGEFVSLIIYVTSELCNRFGFVFVSIEVSVEYVS